MNKWHAQVSPRTRERAETRVAKPAASLRLMLSKQNSLPSLCSQSPPPSPPPPETVTFDVFMCVFISIFLRHNSCLPGFY